MYALLTLGAHTQRELRYLVCLCVCVCVYVCLFAILALEATKLCLSDTKSISAISVFFS